MVNSNPSWANALAIRRDRGMRYFILKVEERKGIVLPADKTSLGKEVKWSEVYDVLVSYKIRSGHNQILYTHTFLCSFEIHS